MLTFEKVLEVFADYLKEDDRVEVVLTSRGYTVMGWESKLQEWSDSDFCATPEDMLEILLGDYETFAEFNMTAGKRDLIPAEQQQIQAECEKFRQLCDELDK